MIRRPPRSTRTDTLFPYTTLFRSRLCAIFGSARFDGSVASPLTCSSATGWTRYERAGNPRGLSRRAHRDRSEEHTSELQSLMRISYAVFCLKKKKKIINKAIKYQSKRTNEVIRQRVRTRRVQ